MRRANGAPAGIARAARNNLTQARNQRHGSRGLAGGIQDSLRCIGFRPGALGIDNAAPMGIGVGSRSDAARATFGEDPLQEFIATGINFKPILGEGLHHGLHIGVVAR